MYWLKNLDELEDSYKHKGMRNSLVEQLKKKGISDMKVLSALLKVPRHFFFETAFHKQAYEDIAFPIGEGQTISQPYTVALQTQLLNVQSGDKILEIGTGSGYQTCILMELLAEVYTIEYNQVLYNRTAAFLPFALGYNPKFYLGDGTKGLPEQSPFDKIIVTAGGPSIPQSLLSQLKIGGIMVIPVGNHQKQKMIRIIREGNDTFVQETFGDFAFVKLIGAEGWL